MTAPGEVLRALGVTIAVLMLAALFGPPAAYAADTVLGFDDLAAGTTVQSYGGVAFGTRAPGHGTPSDGLPVVTDVGTGLAASGAHVGKVSNRCATQPGTDCVGPTETWIAFPSPRSQVSAKV